MLRGWRAAIMLERRGGSGDYLASTLVASWCNGGGGQLLCRQDEDSSDHVGYSCVVCAYYLGATSDPRAQNRARAAYI